MAAGMAVDNHQRMEVARSRRAAPQWADLLSRILGDGSRVVQLEAQLFEMRLTASLKALVDRAIATMLVFYAILIGSTCLFVALIFLLHQWLPWWQSFASVGLLIIAGVTAVNASQILQYNFVWNPAERSHLK